MKRNTHIPCTPTRHTSLIRAQSFALSRIFNRLEVALELTQEDQESLKALRRLQELLQGGIDGAAAGAAGDRGSSSSSPSFPFPPSPASLLSGGGLLPSGFSLQPGAAVGPREAVDAARQAAGLASMIGPGLASIAQKFLVQLAARWVEVRFFLHWLGFLGVRGLELGMGFQVTVGVEASFLGQE